MVEYLEEPRFEVIQKYPSFEVRKYFDTIQARVKASNNTSSSFRRIAGYIFGGNKKSEKIAMTAPVHMWNSGHDNLMAFTMPSKFTLEDLPEPNDKGIELSEVKGNTIAVLSFSWFSGSNKTNRLIQKLKYLVEAEGLIISGNAKLAVYDNPMTTLPFMRRNEIHLPIKL